MEAVDVAVVAANELQSHGACDNDDGNSDGALQKGGEAADEAAAVAIE